MIKVSVTTLDKVDAAVPRLVFAFSDDGGLFAAKHLSTAARRQLLDAAKAEGFKGSAGSQVAVAVSETGAARRYLVCGLGPRKELSAEAVRRASGGAASYARSRWPTLAVFAGELQAAAAEGLLLGSYRFNDYRKPDDGERLSEAALVTKTPAQRRAAERAIERARLACESVAFVRDLVNRGPSDKSPQSLGKLAQSLAGHGVSVKIIDRAKAQELGMGSFLGVARGSSVEPVFVHLVYKPSGAAKRKIGLVGKGITFDSGGLSLKPPASMETMKMDMAGAASVLGVFKALPRLAPKTEIHGFCAFTYNMPGPDALKPGDVVRAMNGKTIEVLNTDAEGRLILADALVYAGQQKLDAIIDLATLTGAVVTALGSKVAAAMGNDRDLLKRLAAAGERAGEPMCELPLFADYKELIKSPVADIQNIGKARGEAGSIIGGLFLQEFVDGTPWVHLDIAGTAWNDHASAYCSVGGTGVPVRTLINYLDQL